MQQEGLTRNLQIFARFLEAASFSQGSTLNITEVARECGANRKLAEQYFFILEDSHDDLWFAHNSGVTKYDGTDFTIFSKKEGRGLYEVRDIAEDSKGNLWFGSEMGGGVTKYNGRTFSNLIEEDGLSNCRVWSILEDSQNNIWFSTLGGGVNVHQNESFQHFIHMV